MNAFVPAFVAVLLAEIGGALANIGRERRSFAVLAMALLVTVAVVSGSWSAAMLMPAARTLMLGLALVFAGTAQFGQLPAATGKPAILATARTLYRSPTPFLAFGFAAGMGAPISAGIGAIVGVAVATAAGSERLGGRKASTRTVRRISGLVLCLAGIFASLDGLRLI